MNAIVNREPGQELPAVGGIAADAGILTAQRELRADRQVPEIKAVNVDVTDAGEPLAPLFPPDVAKDFRSRWNDIQTGFIDDPRQAVRKGDEFVGEVIKSLADTFARERTLLDRQLENTAKESTETLRVALRRYRSLFERLLSF